MMESSMHDLGRGLVACIIKDITRNNSELTVDDFCDSRLKKQWIVADTVSKSALAQAIISAVWRYPHVSGVAMKYLQKEGIDVAEVIHHGLEDFHTFPAFRVWDNNHHRNVVWYGLSVLKIQRSDDSDQKEAQKLCKAIKLQLISRGLMSATKVRQILDRVTEFPWVSQVLTKLQGQNLTEEDKMHILTYISCLIFKSAYHSDVFVSFGPLSHMHHTLPVPHGILIQLNILDTTPHPHIYKREGVPYKQPHRSLPTWIPIEKPNAENQSIACAEDTVEQEELGDIAEDGLETMVNETDDDIGAGGRADLRPDPISSKRLMPHASTRWQEQELNILKQIPVTLNRVDSYELYCRKCDEQNISLRTFRAFEQRLCNIRSKDMSLYKGIENSIFASCSDDASKDAYMSYRDKCIKKGIKPKSYLSFCRIINKLNNI